MELNNDEELDDLIDFLLPLVKSCLGENYIEHTRDAMLDYQKFLIEFGGDWNTDDLTPLQDRVLIFRIIQIICSFYTLNVSLHKELYWKSCYDRDFQEKTVKVREEDVLNDAYHKSMASLDERSLIVLELRNRLKASDSEIAHLIEIPITEVSKIHENAWGLYLAEMRKNGVEIKD